MPQGISIHALLAESDNVISAYVHKDENFYPRSPCGERHEALHRGWFLPNFYPRSPCGERPWGAKKYATTYTISIHALLAESDLLARK